MLFFNQISFAQGEPTSGIKKFSHAVTLGYNLGATAPFSLPNTIREINSYQLLFTPSIGYEVKRHFNDRWGIGGGIQFGIKGMKVTDSVQYFHTILTMEDGQFEGDFSGTNQTQVYNAYLVVPLYGVYQSKLWSFKLGGYLAYAMSKRFKGFVADGYIRKGNSLGGKVLIDKSSFDFSNEMKDWDWGVYAGVGRRFDANWSVNFNVQLGLEPIFPDSFKGVGYKLRNIYTNIAASYNLGSF